LGLSLFGIPFVLGTLFLGSLALMTVFGRTVVWVDGNQGYVFAGIGPFGRKRRFDWSLITEVYEEAMSGRQAGSTGTIITPGGNPNLSLAGMVKDGGRQFLLNARGYEFAQGPIAGAQKTWAEKDSGREIPNEFDGALTPQPVPENAPRGLQPIAPAD